MGNCRTHPKEWQKAVYYTLAGEPSKEEIARFRRLFFRDGVVNKGIKREIITEQDGEVMIFESLKECARHYGVDVGSISWRIGKETAKRGKLKGIRFMDVEENDGNE